MLTDFGVLKPDVPRAGWQAEVYEVWRQSRRLREQKEWKEFFALWRERPIQHDPEWRTRFLSVTCAREGNYWVWGLTREAMIVAATTAVPSAGLSLELLAGMVALPYAIRYLRKEFS